MSESTGNGPHDDPSTGRTERIDFFGAGPSPTLPVPTTPAPTPTPAPAPAPTPAAAPASPGPAPAGTGSRVRRGVRVRTVVFGLVLLAISVTSLIDVVSGVRLNGAAVGLALLIGAGAALLVGGLTAAVRDVRRGGTRFT